MVPGQDYNPRPMNRESDVLTTPPSCRHIFYSFIYEFFTILGGDTKRRKLTDTKIMSTIQKGTKTA